MDYQQPTKKSKIFANHLKRKNTDYKISFKKNRVNDDISNPFYFNDIFLNFRQQISNGDFYFYNSS